MSRRGRWLGTLCCAGFVVACSNHRVEVFPDAGVDPTAAAAPGGKCTNPGLLDLRESRRRWAELAAASGDTYWYEEENCVVNSLTGALTHVQVRDGDVEMAMRSAIERDACEATINRYDDFRALTFEQIYQTCDTLLHDHCDASLVIDERGVLRTCAFHFDPPDCLDNCGEGLHIRQWEFGQRIED